MLIEGVLGVMALVAVMAMQPESFSELGKNPAAAFAVGISTFSGALGMDVTYAKIFISLAISAFMMTSLDTATRLGRFLLQELFMPRAKSESAEDEAVVKNLNPVRRLFINKYISSLAMVVVSVFMALSGEAGSLWPIFGASNQLMAALTFLVITLWLLARGANFYVALIPMFFMMFMSLWGFILVVQQQWGHNTVLVVMGVLLTIMSLMMVALGLSIILQRLKQHARGETVSEL